MLLLGKHLPVIPQLRIFGNHITEKRLGTPAHIALQIQLSLPDLHPEGAYGLHLGNRMKLLAVNDYPVHIKYKRLFRHKTKPFTKFNIYKTH